MALFSHEQTTHDPHFFQNLKYTAGKNGNMGGIVLMQEGNILKWIMLKNYGVGIVFLILSENLLNQPNTCKFM